MPSEFCLHTHTLSIWVELISINSTHLNRVLMLSLTEESQRARQCVWTGSKGAGESLQGQVAVYVYAFIFHPVCMCQFAQLSLRSCSD